MENIQLPENILGAIELKAEHEAALHFNPLYSRDQNTACHISYRNGAKEYAFKLYKAEQEIDGLKQWKQQAIDILAPLMHYADDHFELKLGESKSELILKRCNDFQQAQILLHQFISRHEAGLLPDRFIYEEVKNFLDGTK